MRAAADWIEARPPAGPLFLDIYPSNQPNSFTLYDDDGQTTGYQSGRFATTVLQARQEQNGEIILSMGESRGSYSGKPASRRVEMTVQRVDKPPKSVTRNDVALPSLNSSEALQAASEGWRYDQHAHTVIVKVEQPSASPAKIIIFSGDQ